MSPLKVTGPIRFPIKMSHKRFYKGDSTSKRSFSDGLFSLGLAYASYSKFRTIKINYNHVKNKLRLFIPRWAQFC